VVTETHIQRAVSQAITAIGVPVIRLQSGKVKSEHGGWLTLAPKGCPDLLLVMPRLSMCEVKAGKGRLSSVQKRMHAQLEARGARVAVVRSAAEALEVVRRWQSEDARVRRLVEAEGALERVGMG
jgi:hypothetical protein